MAGELRVVATAGHVDHGKSTLIARLTGMEPDRWAEEKRRGLTIDLGYAWCVLPSGREIGFVDVPGHERFIANMLAGVGPVPIVLFVVAADEGWKPQSEEHLQILDVLGVAGGVVALTKADLADTAHVETVAAEVRDRLAGTALGDAPIVPVSTRTGAGIDELTSSLDALLEAAAPPEPARPRLFVDRAFTIKGAGTVVTGTLTGDCLSIGEDVELSPGGRVARIRSLQTHARSTERACPVSRVAANLGGVERDEAARGDVLTRPGAWRPTSTIDVELRLVRGLARPLTARGAYSMHVGAGETGARLRLLGTGQLRPGERAFARLRVTHPLTLDVFDAFVLRDAGRRETVAGGRVLDVAPPAREPVARRLAALARRAAASRPELPDLLIEERGAVRAGEVAALVGAAAPPTPANKAWCVSATLHGSVQETVRAHLEAHHRDHPLEEGLDRSRVREAVLGALRHARAPVDGGLADELLADLEERGVIASEAARVRLASHRIEADAHRPDLERLLAAIGGAREPTPPTLSELLAAGFDDAIIQAGVREGTVVRVGGDLVFTAGFVARAEEVVAASPSGVTVSAFRQALGTSRKFAVPLLEWFDRRGLTRREGDLRIPIRDPRR